MNIQTNSQEYNNKMFTTMTNFFFLNNNYDKLKVFEMRMHPYL